MPGDAPLSLAMGGDDRPGDQVEDAGLGPVTFETARQCDQPVDPHPGTEVVVQGGRVVVGLVRHGIR